MCQSRHLRRTGEYFKTRDGNLHSRKDLIVSFSGTVLQSYSLSLKDVHQTDTESVDKRITRVEVKKPLMYYF